LHDSGAEISERLNSKCGCTPDFKKFGLKFLLEARGLFPVVCEAVSGQNPTVWGFRVCWSSRFSVSYHPRRRVD
jgi:hypothetical protein